jgi:protein TonB
MRRSPMNDDAIIDRPVTRLPPRTASRTVAQLAISAAAHLVAVTAIGIVAALTPRGPADAERLAQIRQAPVELPRLVFVAPAAIAGGGGGGGGNRSADPIRRAEAPGRDLATLRTRSTRPTMPPPRETSPVLEEQPPAILLDARPLDSGDSVSAGLPVGGVSYGTSQGPGSGGGVGTGVGTGIGPGRGPGLGAGEGGGTGGGAYRPGGGVTAPRLLSRVAPRYTVDALERRIQGAVWLELVVDRAGHPDDFRVVRSLDRGLDEEAVNAVRQWRFAPGTLAGSPVDVQVVVVVDFRIF